MTDPLPHSTRYDLMASDQVPADEIAAWLKEPDFAAYVEKRQAILKATDTAPAPSRVKVKPLEWPPRCPIGQRVHNRPALVNYTIAHYGADVGVPIYRWAEAHSPWSDALETYEQAKAAAQADYDQRIRSALVDAQSPAPESAEPAYWAVHSKTGMHIGLWPHKADAEKALREYEGGTITPLYAAPAPQAEETEAEKKLRQCQWYWPEHDTESENCAESAQEVVQNIYDWNGKDGDVVAVARGGIVEVTYCASLPPADDSDNDDEFWVDEATKEAAQAKIDAEQGRRAALRANGGQP